MKDFRKLSQQLGDAASEARSRDPGQGARVRSVQQQIDAIARGDYLAALETARDDIELDIFAPPEFQWLRRAKGIEEFRRALEHNFSSLEDQEPEITSVLSQGDTVVLLGRERGRIRATGAPYEVEFVHRFTFREGQLASVRVVAARAT